MPTPVVHTRLRAPRASMEPAPDLDAVAEGVPALGEVRDEARAGERPPRRSQKRVEAIAGAREASLTRAKKAPPAPSDPLTDFMTSRHGKALQKEIVRGVFGMLRKRL